MYLLIKADVVKFSSENISMADYSLPPLASVSPLIWLIMEMRGKNMAMTMLPTMTARNTIMIGSSSEVMAATALSTSSSKLSAIFKSISGSAPVCSPTSTMLMTIGGNTREASSGAVMVSPSFTLSWTLATASAMMTLPAVSLTMVSACKIGTPLLTSVPSVRQKREMETLLMTWPVGGMTSLVLSQMRRPNFVLMKSKNKTTSTATPPAVSRK